MQTFYNQTRKRDNTVILIKDSSEKVFGAFCCEQWGISYHFYGIGESFVFEFEEDDIRVFEYTGQNTKIQYSDETSLMIGGGKE